MTEVQVPLRRSPPPLRVLCIDGVQRASGCGADPGNNEPATQKALLTSCYLLHTRHLRSTLGSINTTQQCALVL